MRVQALCHRERVRREPSRAVASSSSPTQPNRRAGVASRREITATFAARPPNVRQKRCAIRLAPALTGASTESAKSAAAVPAEKTAGSLGMAQVVGPEERASTSPLSLLSRDTLYMGFGFEGIAGARTRNQVMDRVVDYLRR